jgi:hypothetical protein
MNINGRAIQPKRTIHFQNIVNVRPFNFRNEVSQAANANENVIAPLINGINARGNPAIIPSNDPRLHPEFAEALGTDPKHLKLSMQRNRLTRNYGMNLPTINRVRPYENSKRKQNMKTIRRMVAQYDMGYTNHRMMNLMDQYRMNYPQWQNQTDDEVVTRFEQPYKEQMAINAQVARTAANYNAKVAHTIAKGASSHKTRRNRK